MDQIIDKQMARAHREWVELGKAGILALDGASDHLGQAIERLDRAYEALKNIEPDLAEDLKVTVRRARDVEHFVLDLQDREPADPAHIADCQNDEAKEYDYDR